MDGNELNPDGIAELCFFLPKKLVNAYCDVEFIRLAFFFSRQWHRQQYKLYVNGKILP